MQKILEGFNFTAPRPVYDRDVFEPNDFLRMGAALGVETFDDKHQNFLQFQCIRFLALVVAWEQAPRPGDVRRHLEKVHSDVALLRETLDALGRVDASNEPAKQVALTFLCSSLLEKNWGEDKREFSDFTERLCLLEKTAEDAASKLPKDKGGASGDFPLEDLIDNLAKFFTEITNKRPAITTDPHAEPENEYKGRFLDFVEAFLKPLAPHYHKRRRVLGASIKRILAHG